MTTKRRAFPYGCLIVAGMVWGGSPAMVRGQESAGASTTAAVISSVAITQDVQRAAVRVEGAGHLDVHAVRMQNPERLVLDFAGARMSVHQSSRPPIRRHRRRSVQLPRSPPKPRRPVIPVTAPEGRMPISHCRIK